MSYETVTAEDLYSMHKSYAVALEAAKRTEITDSEAGGLACDRGVLKALLSWNREYADELESARRMYLPGSDSDGLATARGVLETVDLEVDVATGSPEAEEFVQDLLTSRAGFVQQAILEPKLDIRRSKVAGAATRLAIVDIYAGEVFKAQGDAWHAEALQMNEQLAQ